MPRIGRIVGVDLPHHITQRGNYRQDIFEDDKDYEKYLTLLKAESDKYGLSIVAYCLMANHVHFIVIPDRSESMANGFKYLNMKYSQYFNKKKGERGHLFQGRFFSSVMDERYTIACARYIERNPARAKIVKNPWEWRWSSARTHCAMDNRDDLSVKKLFSNIEFRQDEWKRFITQEDNPEEVKRIKKETIRGRPIADINFIDKLGKLLKRKLTVKSKGRPRKRQNKAAK